MKTFGHDTLSLFFLYDPETGIFTHNPNRPISSFNNARGIRSWLSTTSGRQAGTVTSQGYVAINFSENGSRRTLLAHRAAYAMGHKLDTSLSGKIIDHLNGNKQDNRLSNLRLSSAKLNGLNALYPLGASGLRGVTRHTDGRFRAKINEGPKTKHIGIFDSKEEAHQAYRAAASNTHRTERHINGH